MNPITLQFKSSKAIAQGKSSWKSLRVESTGIRGRSVSGSTLLMSSNFLQMHSCTGFLTWLSTPKTKWYFKLVHKRHSSCGGGAFHLNLKHRISKGRITTVTLWILLKLKYRKNLNFSSVIKSKALRVTCWSHVHTHGRNYIPIQDVNLHISNVLCAQESSKKSVFPLLKDN